MARCRRWLCIQLPGITTVAIVSFFIAEFTLRPNLVPNNTSEEPRFFFFENATAELVAAGHPREEQLRTSLTTLKRFFITDYVKWHSATVSAIKEGRTAKGTIKTVIYTGSGALGDRFRGLLHALFRCVFSRRLLLIKWHGKYPLSKAFVNQPGFNMTYDPIYFSPNFLPNGSYDEMYVGVSNHSDLDYLSTAGTLWMTASPKSSLADALLWTTTFPRLPTSCKLSKKFALENTPKESEFYPLVLRALFKPTHELRKVMSGGTKSRNIFLRLYQEMRNYEETGNEYEEYVSLHARLGYGTNEIGGRFDLKKYGHTMKSVAECMATKGLERAGETRVDPPRFYLATDTVAFREMFRKALLKQARRAEVMYGSWDVKHVEKLSTRNGRDLYRYLYTFMDLYMLSEGKGMLQTMSGFSNLAVWMGGIQSATVFNVTDCDG